MARVRHYVSEGNIVNLKKNYAPAIEKFCYSKSLESFKVLKTFEYPLLCINRQGL